MKKYCKNCNSKINNSITSNPYCTRKPCYLLYKRHYIATARRQNPAKYAAMVDKSNANRRKKRKTDTGYALGLMAEYKKKNKREGLPVRVCDSALLFVLEPFCHYCGAEVHGRAGLFDNRNVRAASADHDIPRKRGGKHSLDNLVTACWGCNRAKGNMTGKEFVQMAKAVANNHSTGV